VAAVTQLGYLGIGVRDLSEWEPYAQTVLGLGIAERESDGTLLLRMDGHHHRFAVHEDGRDDIDYVGWETESAADVQVIAGRLEAAGVQVDAGTREDAAQRHVTGLIKFLDPDGHRCEVYHGPEMAASEFSSSKPETRFVAEAQGLGHLVLAATNLERAMDFYTTALGMKVTDYVSRPLNLGFLHCNPRHHSLAFAELPQARKRINHFMLQLDSIDAVGRTYDGVQDGSAPLLVTMGRHSNDEMVSFYMANPSRFGVEYGWGAREVDDCSWEVAHYESGSLWGHKPVQRRDPVAQT
jgi:extradiol dioxygenase